MDARTRYQPELDGLRAVAIIPAVLFHAGFPGLSGGFAGVDIFFVLSGFLISRLLLIELKHTGTIDFREFYARRVRRLFPALASVVISVLLLGAFILSPALEQPELSKSATATMTFVSNVYFWRAQANYFAPPTDWIPLLNMWTLSVEEQFYLALPALLMLAALAGRRGNLPMSFVARIIYCAAFGTSLAMFWWFTNKKPVAAFYLTPMRSWEFALGGLLALAEGHIKRLGRAGGPVAMLGLLSIAVDVTLRHEGLFSRVAIAAFGSAATIAGITAAPGAVAARFLKLGPMAAIGKLSYSWYLWHWPLLAFERILAPGHDSLFRTLPVAAGALALAAVTYVFIENPIRRRRIGAYQTLMAGTILSFCVVTLSAALLLQANAALHYDPWLTAIDAAARTKPVTAGCAFSQTFSKLEAARTCATGQSSQPPTILVWGDSQAQQLSAMMQKAGEEGSYSAVIWSMSSCPSVVSMPFERNELANSCHEFNRAVASELPALARGGLTGIVLASRSFGFPGPAAQARKLEEWRSGMRQILSMTRDLHARLLIVAPIPVFELMLPECLAHAPAAQCGSLRSMVESQREPLLAALRVIAADYENVRIWDPAGVFCDDRVCTPVRDGTIMYSDSGHLSVRGAQTLAAFATPGLSWLRGR